jgi:hypothetical protein
LEAPEATIRPTTRADESFWKFDNEPDGSTPKGFSFDRTGAGSMGTWLTRADPGAPSGPNVLAQVDTDETSSRFPMALAERPSLADVSVTVKCRPVSGRVDQACGLVARYQDKGSYYLTRANALEGNIRLYVVRDGSRQQLASVDHPVTSGGWHELRLDVQKDELAVYWEGERIIQHRDPTISKPGLIGVWTKADSVTYFDDLRARAL